MRKASAGAIAATIFMIFVMGYSAPVLNTVDTVVCAGRYGLFVSTVDAAESGTRCAPVASVARYLMAAFLISGGITIAGIILGTRRKTGHASLG